MRNKSIWSESYGRVYARSVFALVLAVVWDEHAMTTLDELGEDDRFAALADVDRMTADVLWSI